MAFSVLPAHSLLLSRQRLQRPTGAGSRPGAAAPIGRRPCRPGIRHCLIGVITVALCLWTVVPGLCLVAPAAAAEGATGAAALESGRVIRVDQSHDRKAFDYRVVGIERKEAYSVVRLTYPSPIETKLPQNNTIPAEYYLPHGVSPDSPRPAVICLHILDGNLELVRICCSSLASRGVPAVLFLLPYYGQRGDGSGHRGLLSNMELLAEAVRQSVADVRRTVDVLQSRPEIDPQRIGACGISLGALIAASAFAEEPRLHRAALILGGGDLAEIIAHANETRRLREAMARLSTEDLARAKRAVAEADPLRNAAQARSRAEKGLVLMINAAQDEVIPPRCARKLAEAYGMADRIRWLEGLGHYTALAALPGILREVNEFFAGDLPAGVAAAPAAENGPARLAAQLVREAIAMIVRPPVEGRCHFADLTVVVARSKNELRIPVRWIHGDRGRFRFSADVPGFGRAELGQDDRPWLRAGDKAVFIGEKAVDEPPALLALIDAEAQTKIKSVAGAVDGALTVPAVLDSLAKFEREQRDDGSTIVRIMPFRKQVGPIEVRWPAGSRTPDRIDFEVEKTRGYAQIRVWQLDGPSRPELFAAPENLKREAVDTEDLHRMFAAIIHFALEQAQ